MRGLRRQGAGNGHPPENTRNLPPRKLGEGGAARRAVSSRRRAGVCGSAGSVSGGTVCRLPLAGRRRRRHFDGLSGASVGHALSPFQGSRAGRTARVDAPDHRRLRKPFRRGRSGLPRPGRTVTLSQKSPEKSSQFPPDKTCQNAVQKPVFMLY